VGELYKPDYQATAWIEVENLSHSSLSPPSAVSDRGYNGQFPIR